MIRDLELVMQERQSHLQLGIVVKRADPSLCSSVKETFDLAQKTTIIRCSVLCLNTNEENI